MCLIERNWWQNHAQKKTGISTVHLENFRCCLADIAHDGGLSQPLVCLKPTAMCIRSSIRMHWDAKKLDSAARPIMQLAEYNRGV